MIENMLHTKREDIKFPRRAAPVVAEYDIIEVREAPLQRQSFSYDYVHTMELKVWTQFTSNDLELERKKENAKMQLRHELYKEAISGLHEIIGASSEPEVQALASKLIDRMIGR